MKFHLLIKLFFLLTVLKACESSISYNDDNLNINRDKSSNDLILKEDINSLGSSLYSFIALGDSYTVGEGVNEYERWPNQFVDIANENGFYFDQPVIIAETGWKTYDLLDSINQTNFNSKYDYISLLIGVNNQFNSRPIHEFEEDLNKLMDEMNRIKKDDGSIIIISIPDWGYTPFAESVEMIDISELQTIIFTQVKQCIQSGLIKFLIFG